MNYILSILLVKNKFEDNIDYALTLVQKIL